MAGARHSTFLPDEAATEQFGAQLAAVLQAHHTDDVLLLLQGELGAGKTTFARGLLRAFGHVGPVPSPTYTLLEPYVFDGMNVHHLDLYRLADDAELEYLGWRDIEHSVRLVEWPERCPSLLAGADLRIRLALSDDGREAIVEPLSALGETLSDTLFGPQLD